MAQHVDDAHKHVEFENLVCETKVRVQDSLENQQSEGNIRQCGKKNTKNAEKLEGKECIGYDIQETEMREVGLGFFLYKIITSWVSYSQKAKERRLKTKQSTGKYIRNSKRMIRFW